MRTAAAHTLHRLRRWWGLLCLRTRQAQLSWQIERLETDIADATAVMAALLVERRAIAMRLAQATTPPAAPAHPMTWGM